jgi:hypothetical protein
MPNLISISCFGDSVRMSSDQGLIRAAAEQMAQQATTAMERSETRGQRAQARQLQRAADWLGRPPRRHRRSPREIQEIIRAVFTARPSAAFLTKDLCEIIHPKLPTRKNIAETNRPARKVVAADPDWTCALSADQREVVFFNRNNERSVQAAQTLLASKPKQTHMRRPPKPLASSAHAAVGTRQRHVSGPGHGVS